MSGLRARPGRVSDGMVALLKSCYRVGPTQAKTYHHADLVVCLMRGHERQPAGPDMICEVFVPAPTDLVHEHEIDAARGEVRVR